MTPVNDLMSAICSVSIPIIIAINRCSHATEVSHILSRHEYINLIYKKIDNYCVSCVLLANLLPFSAILFTFCVRCHRYLL